MSKKIIITGEWKPLEPFGFDFRQGYKRANGNWDETGYTGVEGRVHNGVFQTRTTVKIVKNVTPTNPEQSETVTEKISNLFPAESGQRIGRRDSGEYVAREPGQFHIARVA